MILRVSIGVAACAILVTSCGTQAAPQAGPATEAAASRPGSPPPLACQRYSEIVFDHFGLGKGADSPEDLAPRFEAPGSRVVVDQGGEGATLYVISDDGDETLAIIRASNIGDRWRADSVKSCASYVPGMSRRGLAAG
jgi:hypothetical protein